jgi:hypothetical protein
MLTGLYVCSPLLQAIGTNSQESAKALQQKLAAGVEQASSGVADSISKVQQVAAEHGTHSSSMAGKLQAQTKVRGHCWCTAHTAAVKPRVRHVQVALQGGSSIADVLCSVNAEGCTQQFRACFI